VLQADGQDATCERTANISHATYAASQTSGRFEGELVFKAQVFLHHAQDRLGSVESLRANLLHDLLESGIFRHIHPPLVFGLLE
jgi:hypothetical protein